MAKTLGGKGTAFDLDDANTNSCSSFVNQLITKGAVKTTADVNGNETITAIPSVSIS